MTVSRYMGSEWDGHANVGSRSVPGTPRCHVDVPRRTVIADGPALFLFNAIHLKPVRIDNETACKLSQSSMRDAMLIVSLETPN